MKKLAKVILSLLVVAGLASTSLAETKKTDASQNAGAQPKITKNEAQHMVMKKYLGARIVSCESKTVNGKAVWVVTFAETGSNTNRTVQVDEQTGKITR